jgi:hypothetical protein
MCTFIKNISTIYIHSSTLFHHIKTLSGIDFTHAQTSDAPVDRWVGGTGERWTGGTGGWWTGGTGD